LGVLYGQTAFGVSARLGIPVEAAQAILDQHRDLFPTFWDWSERVVQAAFDRREMRTPCGWASGVPPFSNERTWMNFPVQATGADVMRLVVTYLDRQNVALLAPLHDGFVISCRRDQLPELRAAVDFACRTAGEQVLPGFPLRWDLDVHAGGRFEDEEGQPLWELIREALTEFYPSHAEHLR
jgi:DNA polymerase I-like protein with 3'-5' exonuclease and polymerase domains